jgi:hypothetical protein
MKRSEETFVRVLDAILTYGSLTKASAAAEIDPWTLARWRKASEDGDEAYQEVDYRGVIQPFHAHVEDTIEQSIDEIESNFRSNARDGYYRPILWHGDYQYEDDEYAMTLSEKGFQDELDLGLVWPDKKRRVRNANGEWERVKILEWIPPSTEAQTIVLRSWSERYADKRSLTVNGRLDVNQNLGVTVVGVPRIAPPPQQLQVIPPEVADVVNEEVTDAVSDEAEPDEEPMPTAPEQLPPPDPNSPLTPEQQAILARARSGNKLAADLAARASLKPAPKPTAAPRPLMPQPQMYRGDLDQDDSVQRNPVGKKVV